jgi:hypothetical protein
VHRLTLAAALAGAIAGALASTSTAGAQESVPSLSAARVTAQVGLGTLATPVAFVAGGLGSRMVARAVGASDESARRVAYVGAYAGVWVATAAIPAAIGRDGRFPAALAGSALGMAAATGAVRLGNLLYDSGKRNCGVLCWTLGALVVALPSVGATIAYDASRR